MKLKLDQTQVRALEEIERCLKLRAADVKRFLDLRSKSAAGGRAYRMGEPDALDEGALANTFGILGPRGAGKSTILRLLFDCHQGQDSEEDLFYLSPLDCSLIGNDVSPGAAVLLHLEREIGRRLGLKKTEEMRKSLRSLAGSHLAATTEFNTLGAEWASGPVDHIHFRVNGIAERLNLRERLDSWLSTAGELINRTVFVILLDDFDLVHAAEVRRWMLALLDELHQPRLLIILTADFYRLEHLSPDPEAEFDDKTGRALLEKMLPSQNRINLDRWDYEARENFGSKEEKEGAGKPVEQDGETPNRGGLGEEIAALGWGRKAQVALLKRLLPGWPRGLMNLYARFSESKQGRPVQGKSEKDRLAMSLSILSSCRAEPLLARELRASPLTSWVRKLRFRWDDISVEDWQEAVDGAEERERDMRGVDFRPIALLNPVLTLSSREDGREGQEAIDELFVQANVDRSDVAGRDSLRHDALRVKPLRDAQSPAAPLWAELLVNFGMMAPPPEPDGTWKIRDRHEAIRNRAHFLDHWGPVQERLRGAVFSVKDLHPKELRDFFLDNDDIPSSVLLWVEWEGKAKIDLQIGWPPLLGALRRSRRPLEREKMYDLLLDPSRLTGQVIAGGAPDDLDLIPDEVWAIILLVDALDRCPWSSLGGAAPWRVQTFLLLAVAFVRSSYVYALTRSSELTDDSLKEDQKWFVESLRGRDSLRFIHIEEDLLVKRIQGLMGDGLEHKIAESSSLSRAAKAFLSSAAYKDLKGFILPPQS